jgi:thioredoxin-like negative regulator of GroEL
MLFFSNSNYVSLITKTVLGEVVKKYYREFNIKVIEVNCDSKKEVCKLYGVSGVPVTLVFWNDELVGRHHGEITFKKFKTMLKPKLIDFLFYRRISVYFSLQIRVNCSRLAQTRFF